MKELPACLQGGINYYQSLQGGINYYQTLQGGINYHQTLQGGINYYELLKEWSFIIRQQNKTIYPVQPISITNLLSWKHIYNSALPFIYLFIANITNLMTCCKQKIKIHSKSLKPQIWCNHNKYWLDCLKIIYILHSFVNGNLCGTYDRLRPIHKQN